jgi:hypothetical protein
MTTAPMLPALTGLLGVFATSTVFSPGPVAADPASLARTPHPGGGPADAGR